MCIIVLFQQISYGTINSNYYTSEDQEKILEDLRQNRVYRDKKEKSEQNVSKNQKRQVRPCFGRVLEGLTNKIEWGKIVGEGDK